MPLLTRIALVSILRGAALTLGLASLTVVRGQPSGDPSGGAPIVERLPNGLQLVLAPDSRQSGITVAISYDAGSRVEDVATVGIGHLVEHLMFRGTARHPDLLREYATRGAAKNAQTWFDHTVFFTSLPAADSNVAWVMEVEADRMRNVVFTPEGFEAERRVVQTEIVTTKGTFGEHELLEAVRRVAFGAHPYARSIGGTPAQVGAITLDQAHAFYDRHYRPGNATVVVSGRFTADSARAAAHRYFGSIDAPTVSASLPVAPPRRGGSQPVRVSRAGDVRRAVVFARMPRGTDPEFATAAVVQALLSGSASPLRAVARRYGLGRVTASLETRREDGELAVIATLPDTVSPQHVTAALRAALLQLSTNSIMEAEVQRAIRRLAQDPEGGRPTGASLALTLAEWSQRGDWNGGAVLVERARRVTPADIQAFARRWLADSLMTVGWSTHETGSDALAAAPAISSEDELLTLEKKVVRVILPSGLRVALLADSTIAKDVHAILFMHVGNARVESERAVGVLLGRMLRQGPEAWDISLSDSAASLGARLFLGGGPLSARAQFTVSREHASTVVAMIANALRQPALTAEQFADAKRVALGNARELRTMTGLAGFTVMERMMDGAPAPDAGSPEEQLRELEPVTLERVRDFHRRYYGVSRAEIAVVGHFDAAEMERALRAAFGDWRSKEPYIAPASGTLHSDRRRSIKVPGITGANVFAGIPFTLDSTHREAAALHVISFIVGGTRNNASRLRSRIRNDAGIAYTVAAQSVDRPYATGRPYLLIDINTTPEQVDRVEAMIREELERVARDGLTDDEIGRAKGALIASRAANHRAPLWLADQLQIGLFWGRTLQHEAEYTRALAALTPSDIAQAIRKHIRPDAMHILMYVPAR